MRRFLYLLFFSLFFSLVVASIEVYDYTLDDSYFLQGRIGGSINLTIIDEEYSQNIYSSEGDYILLEDFLRANGVDFECNPFDCSAGYSYSEEAYSKYVSVLPLESGAVGFVLEGDDVAIDTFSLNIQSDFEESPRVPLVVNFFGKMRWEFAGFSESFGGENWGCYNPLIGTEGALIGDSFYCEMISLPNSGGLIMGADIGGSGSGEVDMVIYPKGETGSSLKCSFDPNLENGCSVPLEDDVFPEGEYQVCVGSDSLTGYRIYDEEDGENCGFVYGGNAQDSVKDYAIFARSSQYLDASFLDWSDFSDENVVNAANDFIRERYNGNCTDGCVLPVFFSGVSQNIDISDVQITYTDKQEWQSSEKVYDLSIVPASVSYEGILDLGLLNFNVEEEGELTVFLGDDVLIEEVFEELSGFGVSSVFPLNPPFGVPVKFYADVNFRENESLQYQWDFGDGEIANTDVPFVVHSYEGLGNYTLFLKVNNKEGILGERSFDVNVISPESAIGANLLFKRNGLLAVESAVSDFDWYREQLLNYIGFDSVIGDLDRLEGAWNTSSSEESLREVTEELFALRSPVLIFSNTFNVPYLINDVSDIEIGPIESVSGDLSGVSGKDYAKPILTWQNANIDFRYAGEEIFVTYSDWEDEFVLRSYDIDVSSRSKEQSYLVIDKRLEDLFFRQDVAAVSADDFTVINLGPGESKKIEFYCTIDDPVSFFISPRLSSLVVSSDIDVTCNYDGICDPEKGETSDNCRSDCKPIVRAVVFFILGFIFLLIAYSFLQVWYKKRYENYLFEDPAQSYNLLMYVTNARSRGMSDAVIKSELRSKGWSSERVDYIVKKSKGERVGMFEIIPIEKISSLWRNWKMSRAEKKGVGEAFQ